MRSRPVVVFLTDIVPYPPPLIGSMLRVGRLARELSQEFDVAVVCQSEYDSQTLASNWKIEHSSFPIVSVPKPVRDPARDALWGSPTSVVESTLLTLVPDRAPRVFDSAWSDVFVEEIRRLLSRVPDAVVWAHKSFVAEMARAAGAKRILVDIDDFQGALMMEQLANSDFYVRKPFHQLQARHLVRYERDLPRRFSSAAVSKPEDLERLERGRDRQSRIHVVPNGVDVPDVVDRDRTRPCELLFVGALRWEPNIEGLTSFVTDVFPQIRRDLPTARLVVAGRGPAPDTLARLLDRPEIELHESPASLTDFYARAAISVSMLLTGGGTSLKTIESLAYAIPTVATSVAARGLGMQHGRDLLIADSPAEFAQECIRLLQQPAEARILGLNGRQEVIKRLSWKTIGVQARSAVRELVDTPTA